MCYLTQYKQINMTNIIINKINQFFNSISIKYCCCLRSLGVPLLSIIFKKRMVDIIFVTYIFIHRPYGIEPELGKGNLYFMQLYLVKF